MLRLVKKYASNDELSFVGTEHKCPVCKRTFITKDIAVYAYKRRIRGHMVPFCSWKCICTYDEKHYGARMRKAKQKIERELNGELL